MDHGVVNRCVPALSRPLESIIESLLPGAEKPFRYLGIECNAVRRTPSADGVRWALLFPDVYEIGMSWTGQQILYSILNGHPGTSAERAYAFWPSMEKRMREEGVPAFSLETWTPLGEFDILGFTLQYELIYTNILALLDMAGIPLKSASRGKGGEGGEDGKGARAHPFILAGGPAAFNPEPLADFLDAVVLGDGEEAVLEITEAFRAWRREGASRAEFLKRLAQIPGVYVPSLYAAKGDSGAMIASGGAPARVRRRWIEDLNRSPYPENPIVPLGETVQDRLSVEIQRGCTRACRFCQAGMIYRPARQREPGSVKEILESALRATGHDEVGLLSLSISDYACLEPLLASLLGPARDQEKHQEAEDARGHEAGASREAAGPNGGRRVAVSLPSLRLDSLTEGAAAWVATSRRTGFTLAPEAGTPRLRSVINKPFTDEQIIAAAELVFRLGWRHIKLYFMIGLPTETEEDLAGIVDISRRCLEAGRRHTRQAEITVSVSTFVPKVFTPFQWEPMIAEEQILERQRFLSNAFRKSSITLRWHDARQSFWEGVFSRGDRRLGAAIERAFRGGARFDGWREHFREDVWREAMAAEGLEPAAYALREIPENEVLPWDHLDCGVTREHLARERRRSRQGDFTPDCARGACYGCGVCDGEIVRNRTYERSAMPGESAGRESAGITPPRLGAPRLGAHASCVPLSCVLASENAGGTPALPGGAVSKENLLTPAQRNSPSPAHSIAPPPPLAHPSTAPPPPPSRRFRVRYAKRGRAVWLGHLDSMTALARAFQRAGVRLAYTQGFHPKPRMSFSPALMTGASSESEYMDVDILDEGQGEEQGKAADNAPVNPVAGVVANESANPAAGVVANESANPAADTAAWIGQVNARLPEGYCIVEASLIEKTAPSLGIAIVGLEYDVMLRAGAPDVFADHAGAPKVLANVADTPDVLAEGAAARLLGEFLAREAVLVATGKKTVNVRPFVRAARAIPGGFRLEIAVTPTGGARPPDVARAIVNWPDPAQGVYWRVTKIRTIFRAP